MDLIADRGRRVTVEELNTTRLLAHARKQACKRKFDDMLIVDVDAHHYENEHIGEILPFMENDVLRQLTMAGRAKGRRGGIAADAGRLPGHGRPRHALSAARVARRPSRGKHARRPARPSLDGRDERRLFLPVPDRHAQHRPASAEGNGGRAVLGLQPLAHREGAAGIRRPLLLDAVPAVLGSRRGAAPRSRPSATARASTGFMVTTVRHLPVHDNALHEGLSRDRGARPGARRSTPARTGASRCSRACNRFISVHALGFTLLQHPPLHQLGHQRHGRALPEAAGDLDRIRPRLGAVPDAAARPRIHDAPVGMPAAEEEAVRLHARHVLLVAADGDPGHGGAGVHVPHDQCGDAAAVLLRLSALGLRPADRRSGTCRSCRRRPSTTSSAAPRRGCSSCRRATTSRKRT